MSHRQGDLLGILLQRARCGTAEDASWHDPIALESAVQSRYEHPTLCTELFAEKCNTYVLLQNDWEWQRPELEALLVDEILPSTQYRPVTVFVDALDEVGEKSAREVMRYLHDLNDRIELTGATAKTCLSCRHSLLPPRDLSSRYVGKSTMVKTLPNLAWIV